MFKIKAQQDFAGGILLLVIGIFGIVLGRELTFGSPASMGPGFFPIVLSCMICLCGAVLLLKSLRVSGGVIEHFNLRAVTAVLGAILTLTFLLEPLGLIPAAIIMSVAASFGLRPRPGLIESVAIGVCMSIFAAVIFIFALKMPLKLWWLG